MRIGKLIKIYCDINNIGLRDLSEQIGCSASTLSRIINGKECNVETTINLFNWLFEREK